ncbi:MAG TPA: protein kinase [Vicinamibacterales bacterium]|jgi:serine/threonine-protein kinase
MIGTVIGNYRVVQKLGEGGMGAVYKAVDTLLEREVALKMLRSEYAGQPDLVERFRTEAVTLARLNHPHIATLYGLTRDDERFFMVMEFVHGETLEHLVSQHGPLQAEAATRWTCQVLRAMEYAHRRGVIHRDIKPANLMVTAEEGSIKVMDFGIARVLGSAHQTQLGHVIGTASYMAPEQIRGKEVDGRSDLYSLGIVLYQFVTGHPPFTGSDEFAIMTAQVTQPPTPPSELVDTVPDWLEAAVLRALSKSPDERFASATDFRRALETGLRKLVPDEDLGTGPVTPAGTTPAAGWAGTGSAERVHEAPTERRPARSDAQVTPVTPAPVAVSDAPAESRVTSQPTTARVVEARPAPTVPPPTPRAAGPAKPAVPTPRPAGLAWWYYAGVGALLIALVATPFIWRSLTAVATTTPSASPASATVPPAAATTPAASSAAAVPAAQVPTAPASPPAQAAQVPPSRTPAGQAPSPPIRSAQASTAVTPITPAPRVDTGSRTQPADVRTPLPPLAQQAPPTAAPDASARPVQPAPAAQPPKSAEPAPVVPAHPDAAVAGNGAKAPAGKPVDFEGLGLIRDNGASPVILHLYADRLTVAAEDSGAVVRTVMYKAITGATYSETRQTKSQSKGGFGALKGALSKGTQILGAGKHFLWIDLEGDVVVVRLGRAFKDILPEFERLSGLKVKKVATR